jgi:hypothetical protein
MRGFGSICAIVLVLVYASMARAADSTPAPTSEQTAALAALSPAATGDSIRAVAAGLRQSLADSGVSQALTQASDWVKELELSWTAHRDGRTANGIDTDADAESGLNTTMSSAALVAKDVGFAARPYALNLGLISFGSGGAENQVWELGHAQPLVTTSNAGATTFEDHGLIAGSPALASRDLQLGVRVPMLPWNATIAGDHYWWGTAGFGQQVQGSRVALKLSPVENIEIEGGRAEDTRGAGGFVGVLYRMPLDQGK